MSARKRSPMKNTKKTPLSVVQKKQVKNLIRKNAELKYKDLAIVDAPLQDILGQIPCNDIAQGDLPTEREGNEIRPYKSIFRFMAELPTGSTSDQLIIHMFMLKSRTETSPAGGAYSGNLSASYPISLPDSAHYEDRGSTVMWERWFKLTRNNPIITHTITKKLSGPSKYDGTASTATASGAYTIFYDATNSNGDIVKPTLTYQHRLLYTDS